MTIKLFGGLKEMTSETKELKVWDVGTIVDIINGGRDVTLICKKENGAGIFTIEFDRSAFDKFHEAIEHPLGRKIAFDGDDIEILEIGE